MGLYKYIPAWSESCDISPAVARHADESTHYTFSVTWQHCQFKEVLTCSWVGRHVASWGSGRTPSCDKSSCIKGKQSTDIDCILHLELRQMCKSWMVQILQYCYCTVTVDLSFQHCIYTSMPESPANISTVCCWVRTNGLQHTDQLEGLYYKSAVYSYYLITRQQYLHTACSGPLSSFKCHI